ncbi:MAG: hypothetical protein Q9165_008535 [Trypethelium subeluteriae]
MPSNAPSTFLTSITNPLESNRMHSNPKGTPSTRAPIELDPSMAFYVFLTARVMAALFAPIQDCDEVFNYWEPTHYLNHGYGLQTWEYSPQYALRSWAYIGPHALVTLLARISPIGSKFLEFYLLRLVLAFACSASEAKLFSVISRTLNPRVAIMFLIIMISCTGMFHASTAYLPSSFAMYTTMLGMAAFMNWRGDIRTAEGIFWMGLGAVIGWPFAIIMATPYILEEFVLAWAMEDSKSLFWRFVDGTAIQSCIDGFFYRKLVCVPFNLIWYNVFSSGKGPNMYGTEPWDFYLRNLLLNFNVWFLLGLLAFPMAIVQSYIGKKHASRQNLMRGLVFVSPLYLWLVIFSIQPHKEERFMYPAYPSIALNAAFSLHVLLSLFGSTNSSGIFGRIPPQLKLAVVSTAVFSAVGVGLWRATGIATAYSAPLQVYTPLHTPGIASRGETVCLGKEWYRFPSSYHLPNGIRAKFVKSEFKGLLPGEFREANINFGVYPGTWLVPPGMNDENREDPGKYTDVARCNFLVDSFFPNSQPTKYEPQYILDDTTWQSLKCEPFLDVTQTGILGRLVPLPDWGIVPESFRRKWGKPIHFKEAIAPFSQNDARNSKMLLYALLLSTLVAWGFFTLLRRARRKTPPRSRTPDLEKPTSQKNPERKPGEWIPQDFTRPPATPYPEWSVHTTKPLPYRPFRYGPKYNINMGLRPMNWDEWIELDNHYPRFHADKARRIRDRGSKCCRTAPRAYDAAVELLEELCSYLPQRYPSLFQATSTGMTNVLTGESFNIQERPLAEDPMQMAARTIQDDLAIMIEGDDGQYYLLAGAILLAGFWRLEDKFGMPLSEIHTSGEVPQFREKLEKGMMNFFRRVKPESPVLRNNYFIQVDDELAWSSSIGSEDSEGIGWFTAEKNKAIEHHYFRSERQSLRRWVIALVVRLPRSGGVVFTIRTYFHPMVDVCLEPYVPGRLASAIRSWGDDVSKYKGKERYGEVLLEYLDQKHEEQVAEGLDLSKEDEERKGCE